MRAEPAASKSNEPGFFANFDITVVVAVLLAIGFVITYASIGVNEALRVFAAEALILAITFYVARQYLPWEDAPKERVKRPKTELIIALVAYALLVAWAAVNFGVWSLILPEVVIEFLPLALLLVPVVVFVAWRYGRGAWGFHWPTGRELLVVLIIIALNIGLSQLLGRVLPPNELSGPAGNDFAATIINNAWLATLGVIFGAFITELFFRVFLQTRLAAFQQGRWALLTQALLYSVVFIPYWLSVGYPTTYAIAKALVVSNGIMAGYVWRKTGSLPLLILLSLFYFSRWGL